jgi:beta-lactamase superfamily II metal-dependent hydrolase
MAGLKDYYTRILGHDFSQIRYIDADFVGARLPTTNDLYMLAFGDPVIPQGISNGQANLKVVGGTFDGRTVRCKGQVPLRDKPLLSFSMVDVQQGDGMIFETPGGQVILIDGGDNQLFARHLAARYAHTTEQNRLLVDAIIVTHGDADHFEGLVEIRRSETLTNTPDDPKRERKRLFIEVARAFHNGLAKRPSSLPGGGARPDEQMFGRTVPATPSSAADAHCMDLVDNLMEVAEADLNQPFRQWVAALKHWNTRRAIRMRRVAQSRGEDLRNVFEREAGFTVDVHGPITDLVGGKPGLLLLREPRKSSEMHLSDEPAVTRAFSASHTINGHSIAFRVAFGNVRFLLTGDLNQQAMARLRKALPDLDFQSEILKAPHHGSHDFDFGMLKEAQPVVAMISSGDESEQKEFIHPRATLVAALGKVSRGNTGVIFMTELAAFFKMRGPAHMIDVPAGQVEKPFFAFERTNFGIVHVRTDGSRVLTFTHSGKAGANEGYAFDVDAEHKVKFRPELNILTAPR